MALMKSATVLLLAACSTLAPTTTAAPDGSSSSSLRDGRESRNRRLASAGSKVLLTGEDLGVVPLSDPASVRNQGIDADDAVKEAAGRTLQKILETRFGYSAGGGGARTAIAPVLGQPVRRDRENNVHIRYKQVVDGLPLEGASLAIHFDGATGQVRAVNGEAHNVDSLLKSTPVRSLPLPCTDATEVALKDYANRFGNSSWASDEGTWMSECQRAVVRGRDGTPYLAYKRLYGFQPPPRVARRELGVNSTTVVVALSEPYRLDLIYAERSTGRLVAVHPKVFASRTMTTYQCNNYDAEELVLEGDFVKYCDVVTTDPDRVDTGDETVDLAHNNLADVYDFYQQQFDWTGIDDKDKMIQTLTHVGYSYNNAFYTDAFGGLFGFGDGDGYEYGNWAEVDVVAHEFGHGVTSFSSGLVYAYESGALSEALSDAMGALADRVIKNKNQTGVWYVAEDVDLWNGKGIRSMADPPEFYQPDYFADRYTSYDDEGGVHTNCGIVNKAFYLMVEGGTHPTSEIYVPALNVDFDTSLKQAAELFFRANTLCLTESSDFMSMRECTLMLASPTEQTTVGTAWDAVGVKEIMPLEEGVPLSGLSLLHDHDVQIFVLDRTVVPGESVTCSLTGDEYGDPDLSVRFGRPPYLYPHHGDNDCWSASAGTSENCTATLDTESTETNVYVYVAVESYESTSDMELMCTIHSAYGRRRLPKIKVPRDPPGLRSQRADPKARSGQPEPRSTARTMMDKPRRLASPRTYEIV